MAEEKEAKAEEGSGKKKSPIKLIIILVVVLILLIGGGLGAYFMFFKSKGNAHEGAATEEKAQEKDKKGGNDKKDKKEKKSGKEASIVYSMGAIIVNLADQGVQRYLKVQVAVELDNPKLEEEIKKREPQIKDIVISVLSSKTVSDINTPQGKIALKQEIIKRANMVLTEGEITELFFSEFIIQ